MTEDEYNKMREALWQAFTIQSNYMNSGTVSSSYKVETVGPAIAKTVREICQLDEHWTRHNRRGQKPS